MHSTLIQAIACLTGMIELLCRKHRLPSMTSKRSQMGENFLWFIGASVQQRIRKSKKS